MELSYFFLLEMMEASLNYKWEIPTFFYQIKNLIKVTFISSSSALFRISLS